MPKKEIKNAWILLSLGAGHAFIELKAELIFTHWAQRYGIKYMGVSNHCFYEKGHLFLWKVNEIASFKTGYDIRIIWCIFVKSHAFHLKYLRWDQHCYLTHVDTSAISCINNYGNKHDEMLSIVSLLKKSIIWIFNFSLH